LNGFWMDFEWIFMDFHGILGAWGIMGCHSHFEIQMIQASPKGRPKSPRPRVPQRRVAAAHSWSYRAGIRPPRPWPTWAHFAADSEAQKRWTWLDNVG
jgi:hypothetical protein